MSKRLYRLSLSVVALLVALACLTGCTKDQPVSQAPTTDSTAPQDGGAVTQAPTQGLGQEVIVQEELPEDLTVIEEDDGGDHVIEFEDQPSQEPTTGKPGSSGNTGSTEPAAPEATQPENPGTEPEPDDRFGDIF